MGFFWVRRNLVAPLSLSLCFSVSCEREEEERVVNFGREKEGGIL